MNQEYLYREEGLDTDSSYFGEVRTVSVAKGYLALRNMKAYDASNEIGNYIPAIPYSFWTQVIPSTGMCIP